MAMALSSAPVGTATLGAAAWGQLDMAGETPEWAWYATYVVPCTNCADLLPSSERVSWGTDYTGSASYLMSRGSWGPEERQGFRCARTP
jgi:formylglycine-generating enzyme required for sulfatase activity